jgi:AraC family transcriptional regulator of adaptative response / DNA-3-methyladenine glycosylase II
LLEFLGARAVPGVESWDGETYERALSLPNGHGTVAATLADGYVAATLRLTDWRDLAPAVQRMRRLLDLDADPIAIDDALAGDGALAPLVTRTPGLRAAGSVDPYETLVRAIVGQQVSVAGARTVTGRIAAAIAEPLSIAHSMLTHVFPAMDRIGEADLSVFPMPTARGATLQRVGAAVASGELVLDAGLERTAAIDQLVAIKGIGPWTAEYVAMRGLGDPDVFLGTDLGVKNSMAALDLDASAAERWRPWRTYAMHHLWNTL